ncbi:alpha-ketoglutarate-dependent dioxygenase AlkB [Desertivirga xinjiangensis]|uniref:alpha-ketoglutarate-dependent dioxygenase AlkB n=1 Tax=Desertivirga xinjiangensis TaxID=539206 RepID=UPI00210E8E7C|nr:alpha-ketoglutarate-dependent dioxygenase AlkB [Pedobacter xinjiangensis]
MDTLFSLEPVFPKGFSYFPEFISVTEEDQLLQAISESNLHAFVFQGYEARRKVESFGYDWNFASRTLSKGKEIPTVFKPLIEKVSNLVAIHPTDFAELLLTEYPPGSVINWHRDAPPFDLIAGISLLSDCVFRFKPQDKMKQSRSSLLSFTVKRRSLYVMQGDSRFNWQHSILPVAGKRFSITLRTLLDG